jgi:hypothetical protein
MKMLKAVITPELLYLITLDVRKSDYYSAVEFLG